jgi:hypothetical protein
MDPVDTIFQNLDRWRHLPAYQLERRVDIFFSAYLKGVLEEVTGVALEEEMLPELPIKLDLIWAERVGHSSVKVDYVLFAKDRSKVFFVELKTDAASRRDAQDHYLETASGLGFRKILEGFCSILLKTHAHQKYHHLASALAQLGYLSLPSDLRAFVYPEPRVGLSERLRAVQASGVDSVVEVVYVQPEATEGVRAIDFARFAEYVGRYADPVSQRFAGCLLKWRGAAGSCEPF